MPASFRFIPSGMPAADLLRRARCQLIVTPFPPEGPDIYQLRLFDDHSVCFYDASVRSAPSSLEEFVAADYIEVRFDDSESSLITLFNAEPLALKKPRVSVPNFAAVASFLKGSNLISTELSLMGKINLKGSEEELLDTMSILKNNKSYGAKKTTKTYGKALGNTDHNKENRNKLLFRNY